MALRLESLRAVRSMAGLVAGTGLLVSAAYGCSKKGASEASPTASASASAAHELTPEQAAEVLARVGDRSITLGEYKAALDRMDSFERLRYQSADRRKLLLSEMIELELLAQEAQRRGLDKQPETQERMRQMLRDELFREVRRSIPGPNEVPDVDVRRYYEANKAEFNEPERRRVAHIALASEQQAKQLLEKVQRALSEPASGDPSAGTGGGAGVGADAAEANAAADDKGASGQGPSPAAAAWGRFVMTHSLDKPARSLGSIPPDLAGDLGIVGPVGHERGANPRVPEALRAAVFRVESLGGVLPEVVADGGKFHIVRMTGRTEARERRFEEAERTIRIALVQQRIKQREAELEKELRAKYPVSIDPAALSEVQVPQAAPPTPARSKAASPTQPASSR